MTKLTIEGTQDVARALKEYGAKAEAEIAKAVTATALLVNADIKKRIQRGPKTGVTYHRIAGEDGLMRVYAGGFSENGPNKLVAVFRTGGKANLSATHQSSAPGEAPASDTGVLASSISFRQISPLTAEIESRLVYATYLEFGTRKIAPRPAWVPAIEQARPDFAKRVAEAIRRAAP